MQHQMLAGLFPKQRQLAAVPYVEPWHFPLTNSQQLRASFRGASGLEIDSHHALLLCRTSVCALKLPVAAAPALAEAEAAAAAPV
jgi:hypothetical protein